MLITELIIALEELRAQIGDREVVVNTGQEDLPNGLYPFRVDCPEFTETSPVEIEVLR